MVDGSLMYAQLCTVIGFIETLHLESAASNANGNGTEDIVDNDAFM